MRRTLLAGLIAGAVATPAMVQAEEAAKAVATHSQPDSTFTANATVINEYRYRGISQSNFKPAIQGGFDYAHSSGFYVGNWNSSISWIGDGYKAAGLAAPSNPIEMDFYGGYKGEAAGIGYDVGLLQYYYPGSSLPSATCTALGAQFCGKSPNTTEAYVALTYSIATLKYSRTTGNLFGIDNSRGSGYFDLMLNYETGYEGITLNGHVGRQIVANNAAFSYTDWRLGVTKEFGAGLSASLAYVDTNAKIAVYATPEGKNQGRSTALVSLTKTF